MAGPRQPEHEFGDCDDKDDKRTFHKRLWDRAARRLPSINTFHTSGKVLKLMHESWPQATSGAASSASPPAYSADALLSDDRDYCDLAHLPPSQMLGTQPPIPLSELVATRMRECDDSDAILRQFADCAATATTLSAETTRTAIQTGISEGAQRRGDAVRKRFDNVLAELIADDGAALGLPETGRAPADVNEQFKAFYKAPTVTTSQPFGRVILTVAKCHNGVYIKTSIVQDRADWLRERGEDPIAWAQAQWRLMALQSSDPSAARNAWDAHEELKDAAELLRMADASAALDAAEASAGDEFESDSSLTSDDEASDEGSE
jgi:hypothetical protein